MNDVTLVITSCNRLDLLQKTISSFDKFNTYPIKERIIVDDSGKKENWDQLINKYNTDYKLILNKNNIGQIKSIDSAYSQIITPFIFHCEDDWEFYRSGFIEDSLKVLNSDSKILQVWLRKRDDTNGHTVESQKYSLNGLNYYYMSRLYNKVWSGFAFNPGLRRLDDYNLIKPYDTIKFPDNLNFTIPDYPPNLYKEKCISLTYDKLGYRAIIFEDSYVKHIGWGRTQWVEDRKHIMEEVKDLSGEEQFLRMGIFEIETNKNDESGKMFLEKCLKLNPNNPRALANIGLIFLRQGNKSRAKQYLERSVTLEHTDNHIRTLNQLYFDDKKRANQYLIKIKNKNINDVTKIITYYNNKGNFVKELSWASRFNLPSARLLIPNFYDSLNEIDIFRNNYESYLNILLTSNIRYSLSDFVSKFRIIYPFALSYHNKSNKHLLTKQYETFSHICPELNFTADFSKLNNSKIRVGFLSSHFYSHSVCKDRAGIITHLDKSKFHTVAIFVNDKNDEFSTYIKNNVEEYITLSLNDLFFIQKWRTEIEKLHLDILVHCDIGMYPATYFLAFSKLAPIQCNTWGHSDTSGIGTIDYYISSKLYEIENAQEHYSEKLILTNGLCTYYTNPLTLFDLPDHILRDKDDKFLLNSKDNNIYLSLATTYKLHPIFDNIYKNILQQDPKAIIVFLVFKKCVKYKFFNRLKSIVKENISRIRFFDKLNPIRKYMQLLHLSKIVLDVYPFGGCNSSIEAFVLNKCVITYPSNFISGRFTYGFYKKMGIKDLIVNNEIDYVKLALRVVNDDNYRNMLENKIKMRVSRLFLENQSVIDWNNILEEMWFNKC